MENFLNNPKTLFLCFLFVALLTGGIVVYTRMAKIRKECRETLAERYSKEETLCHDNGAHLLGVENIGGKEIKGSGVLLLTEKELYFLLPLPKKEITIPIKSIKRCLRATNFKGKKLQKPFLHIEYKGDSGLSGIAVYVKDIEKFESSIRQQRKKIRQKKSN